VDGVECGDAVGGGGVQVAAYAAPAGERGEGMPVSGDRLAAFAPRSETLLVQLTLKSRVNRKTCSL
jgi:hypothetical protein